MSLCMRIVHETKARSPRHSCRDRDTVGVGGERLVVVLLFRMPTSVRHSRVALNIFPPVFELSHTTDNNTIRSAKFYSSSNTLYGHALIENNRNAKPRPHF